MKINEELQKDIERRMQDMTATQERISTAPDSVKEETAEAERAARGSK